MECCRDKAWLQVGGSYSGALAAWNEKISPGTFWAYHASSAPVQAVYDYWSYFLPIQNGMAKNCSRDLARIVAHVDDVIASGNASELAILQKSFGLQDLHHVDDFASYVLSMSPLRPRRANMIMLNRAISMPLGNWQSIQLYSNYSTFFMMCDTIEGVRAVSPDGVSKSTNATIPSADGVGLEVALPNFAAWFKTEYFPERE
jgi:hypothetical protein